MRKKTKSYKTLEENRRKNIDGKSRNGIRARVEYGDGRGLNRHLKRSAERMK